MTMGDRPGMPMYPAAMTAVRPTTVPTRWQPAKIVAAVLCFVALVLVVASVFLPLYSGEMHLDGEFSRTRGVEVTYTPWSVEFSPAQEGAENVQVSKVGYPLVFVAVVLAGAACACWYAATPSAGRAAGRTAGAVTTAGVAFLIGTVWTTAVVAAGGVEYFDKLGNAQLGVKTSGSYLIGYWLLLTAVLLGITVAVLALLPPRQPVWLPAGPVSPYMATPPYGIALPPPGRPVVYALPPEPVPPPPGSTVDPLTGEPLPQGPASPPGGVPVTQLAPGNNPMVGQASPPAGLPVQFSPAGVDPLTGQPYPPDGTLAPATQHLGGVDPLAGQPYPPDGTLAPATQHLGPIDPLTGQPLAPGLLSPPPVPFTPEPVGQVNGTHPASTAGPPVVVPDAPPLLDTLPDTLPGPAIPPAEDPLAEPPRP